MSRHIAATLAAVLLGLAASSALAAAPAGRNGRELLQSGVTCANDIPYCTARRCTTRILGNKETYVCLRCQASFVPVRGIDGKSIVQCVCPAGTYYHTTKKNCQKCEKGNYCPGGDTDGKKDNAGGKMNDCNPAGADGLTTKSTGARGPTDCVAKGGYVLPSAPGGDARQCTGASYAPEDNRLKSCLKCQSGLAPPTGFDGPNTDKTEVCQVPPGKFWELNVVRDCPRGLYREGYEKTTVKAAINCRSCPDYWSTNRTGSVSIAECNILLPGHQIKQDTTPGLSIDAQSADSTFDPESYTVELCPIGFYYDASATNYKCAQCPYGSITRKAGAQSIDECMVPPGYFITGPADASDKKMTLCQASNDNVEVAGYYRAGWKSFKEVISRDADGFDMCTKCGDGIMSRAVEVDEHPLVTDGKVAATSASCYIKPGYGMTFDPTDFKLFKAVSCPANTYGVASETFGLINAPCKACAKNLKSSPLSTSYQDCKNPAGFGYTSEGANQCPPAFWAAAESMAPCEPCPEGRTTKYVVGDGSFQASINDCKLQPGFGVFDTESSDPWNPANPSSNMAAKECPMGYFSEGDAEDASSTASPKCVECDEGYSTDNIGSSSCAVCAAGYGKYSGSDACVKCKYGDYSTGQIASCNTCPDTIFADPTGAEFSSYGVTFKTGLPGKESCVPRYAQLPNPAGDRLVLPDDMFTTDTNIPVAAPGNDAAVETAVESCVNACAANTCCIAQMQLDGSKLNCKRAELAPITSYSKKAAADNKARMYYKLPPSEMAAASLRNETIGAKTLASGIYAVCDIATWAESAANGTIGTSFNPSSVEDSNVAKWDECTTEEACKDACSASAVCWGFVWHPVRGFALRGGEMHLHGRTFFASPDGKALSAADDAVTQAIETW